MIDNLSQGGESEQILPGRQWVRNAIGDGDQELMGCEIDASFDVDMRGDHAERRPALNVNRRRREQALHDRRKLAGDRDCPGAGHGI